MGQNSWSHELHEQEGRRTAEVKADGVVVRSAADMIDMIASIVWENEVDSLAIRAENIAPEFFDLSTGIAGEVLQKCSNYQFRLAIIGRFEQYPSSHLQAFIRECNRGRQVVFVGSLQEAMEMWENV